MGTFSEPRWIGVEAAEYGPVLEPTPQFWKPRYRITSDVDYRRHRIALHGRPTTTGGVSMLAARCGIDGQTKKPPARKTRPRALVRNVNR